MIRAGLFHAVRTCVLGVGTQAAGKEDTGTGVEDRVDIPEGPGR